MDQLKEITTANTARLVDRARSHAKAHQFEEVALLDDATWMEAVELVTAALARTLDTYGLKGCNLSPDTPCASPPLTPIAHKPPRGQDAPLSLAMLMGLLKSCRLAYLDLLLKEFGDTSALPEYQSFIDRFFDRMEIDQCLDWARMEEQERLASLTANHETMINEKNRFLTLFNSLTSAVFLLDTDSRIQVMNIAATELLGGTRLRADLRYACTRASDVPSNVPQSPVSLNEAAPWLGKALATPCSSASQARECRIETSTYIDDQQRHFSIKLSSVSDISDHFTGTTVVVDDITLRVQAEKQLAHERNLAANYLDVVGTIVVALDPSGTTLLLNETGSTILGYDKSEIVGKNWVDMVIPAEMRDEVKDYLYSIYADNIALDNEHINYVTTKAGDHRLITWKNRLLRNDDGIPIGILSSGADITEQRKMEEALAEKELWLRNAFVALGEAVLIISPDNMVIDANPAAETIFQMTNAEMCDRPVEELHVDRAHYLEFDQQMQYAFARGRSANLEFTMRRQDGQTFPTEHSVSLITGDDGTVLGIVNALRDTSHRKRAEQILQQSEEKFRRIFETIEEGFVVASLEGTIQMVNPATCTLLGYEQSDLIGQSMEVLYANPDERTRFRQALINKGSVHGFHLTASRKDRSTIVVECNAHVVLDEAGNPSAMEGTFRDITARIETEQMLREREKLYRAFFENNHAVMLLEDPQTGDIVDANPAASEFYGYPLGEMRDMNMTQILAMSEEEVYQEMVRARDEARAYFLFKHTLANRDIRDVEVYSGPILVRGNQLLYSVIHDVTARIRLEKDMKHMATTDALTGANNRHQFFSLAGQELKRSQRYKHPLAVIMLDIDYFKSINDTYGHQAGDVVLKALSTMTIASLRETDIFGRLGGEEFAAVLPETEAEAALHVAQRLREDVAKMTIRTQKKEINFTVSIGVSTVNGQDKQIADALNRADEALYKAKRAGRNRVEKN